MVHKLYLSEGIAMQTLDNAIPRIIYSYPHNIFMSVCENQVGVNLQIYGILVYLESLFFP